jgi:putative ABC transport system substrate-binding protein
MAVAGLGVLAGCGRLSFSMPQSPTVHRIGYLSPNLNAVPAANLAAFRQGLADLGYVEGQSVIIESRHADGQAARLPGLATELVQLPVDVLVSSSPLATYAARDATSSIPIVAVFGGDPVASGLVASYAHPGGNLTGLTYEGFGLAEKHLELLKEILPGMTRVAILRDTNQPATASEVEKLRGPAQMLGVQLQVLETRESADLEPAFEAAVRERADAMLPLGGTVVVAQQARVIALAAQYHLPAIYTWRDFVYAGGLMTYDTDIPALHERAAAFVDKILRGAKPSDLPIERPMRFNFAINLKTAQALGLTIPQHVLLQATEVIQ